MKKLNVLFGLMMVLLAYSCSDVSSPYKPDMNYNSDSSEINIKNIENDPFTSDSSYSDTTGTIVINIVIKIVPGGVVMEKEKEHYRGRWVWKVKVKTKNNGTVKIKIDVKTGRVLHCEGDDGTYDYDIEGLEKFISLIEAFKIATDSVSGVITDWELKYDNEHSWKFEITIMTGTAIYKIEIKAEGGIIIKMKLLDKDDDKDDDDDDDDDDSTGNDEKYRIQK